MGFILNLIFLTLAMSHVAFADANLPVRVPIRDQVSRLWRFLQLNVPSRPQMKAKPRTDCDYLLQSTLYELSAEVEEAIGRMKKGKFNDFISDVVGDEWSRTLLQDVFNSIKPKGRDQGLNARFTLAAFLQLARTAGKQDQPKIRLLIEFAVIERNQAAKSIVSTLIFRLRDRAEEFAEQANLLAPDANDWMTNDMRQRYLRHSSKSLRTVSEAMDIAEVEESDFFFKLAMKAHHDFSIMAGVQRIIREYNRDTHNKIQREFLLLRRYRVRQDLQDLLLVR
jgi:hypothetical protein